MRAVFDTIFLIYVIEHLPSPELVLVTLQSLLKPSGTLVVVTDTKLFTIAHILKEIKLFRIWMIPEILQYLKERHISVRSPAYWSAQLKKLFNNVEELHYNPISFLIKSAPHWTKRLPRSISIDVMFVCKKPM